MKLQQQIELILQDVDATFGIWIKYLQTGEEVNINQDRLFQMASVFKVPLLAKLYELVHERKIDLATRVKITEEDKVPGSGIFQEMDPGVEVTIKDLATMMIIVSDNLATDKLLKMVGAAAVEEKMHEVGLTKMMIKHSCWDLLSLTVGIEPEPYSKAMFDKVLTKLYEEKTDSNNYVLQANNENNLCTPYEMGRLMEMIARGEFVSEECSAGIHDILLRQQLSQRIPGHLPFNTKVAHKTGSIASAINDAGIVYLPNDKGAYVISAFSVGNNTGYEGAETIARISKKAYDYFLNSK